MKRESNNRKYLVDKAIINMLPYVQSTGWFECGEDYKAKRKKYNSILILYTLLGKGHLNYGKYHYLLEKGTIAIIDCNEPHAYYTYEKSKWEFMWLHFIGGTSREQVNFILNHVGPILDAEDTSANCKSVIHNCMLEIQRNITNEGMEIDLYLAKNLDLILNEWLAECLRQKNDSQHKPSCVTEIIEYIHKNYSSNIKIEDLATKLYVNQYDLIRKFKKSIGVTPYNYLIQYRMKEAKRLLITTEFPINEISEQVGFESTSHFIKLFKQYEEMTPLRYRKENK